MRPLRLPVLASVSALFAIVATGCADWRRDVTVHGVAFKRVKIERGTLAIGEIGADTVIHGRPCKQGWVHVYPNGMPAAFATPDVFALPRLIIPANTWVRQDEKGAIVSCAFPRDTEVQGHWCRGTGGAKGVVTTFYPDGALRFFYPPHPTRIDGVPCRPGVLGGWIELYENGRLKSVLLDADWERDGTVYHRGVRVEFDVNGRPLPPASLPPPDVA